MQRGAGDWPPPTQLNWGRPEHFGTLAYWADQCRRTSPPATFRIGSTLVEEVAACLLGGHGVPAEVGLAAFRAVRDRNLIGLAPPPTRHELMACLSEPLCVGSRRVKYRFVRQRSERLSAALGGLAHLKIPSDPLALRGSLLCLSGVGLKTASWIVRNQTASNSVAIIDIHLFRAGIAAGLFDPNWRLPRHYLECEKAFIDFAEAARVPASLLDACIWEQVRQLGRHVRAVMAAVQRNQLRLVVQVRRSGSEVGTHSDSDHVLAGAI